MEKLTFAGYTRILTDPTIDYHPNPPGFLPVIINSRKAPVSPEWNTKPQALEYDPRVLYGAMPPPSILVADVDVKNGKRGLQSWELFLKDNYSEDQLETCVELRFPNVVTPSGGHHYYIRLPDDEIYKSIRKINPRYPDIDFIVHGKSQVVMGDQTLGNGRYTLNHLILLPSFSSFKHLTSINDYPALENGLKSTKPAKKSQIPSLSKFQIQQLLEFIPSEEYNDWYQVAFMLMDSGLSQDEAREVWIEWSQQSDKFNEYDANNRWRQLLASNKSQSKTHITIASLPSLAKQHNPSKIHEINSIVKDNDNLLQSLRGRFVLVQSFTGEAKYYDLQTKTRYIKEAIRKELKPLIDDLTEERSYKSKKNVKISTQDLLNEDIILVADDVAYSPQNGYPFYENSNGKTFLNTYDPANLPTPQPYNQAPDSDITFFKNHIELIFGDYAGDFLDYIAYLAQNPGHKIRYMLVLQGGVGTGKSLIMHAIANHVLGEANTRIVDNGVILDDNNSLLINKQLVIIEELKVPSRDALLVMNRLKTLVTENAVTCKEKYKVSSVVPNVASYIAITNHKDCLKKADQRRFHAVLSPIQDAQIIEKKTGHTQNEYYSRLASIASNNNARGGQLRQFFLDYKISEEFSPDRRPARSDFNKIEIENLNRDEKWGAFIDMVRHLYRTESLPPYIDVKYLKTRSKEINPDSGEPFFPEGAFPTATQFRFFGTSKGYKRKNECLYLDTLDSKEAEDFINTIRKESKFITKDNMPS